MESSPDEIGPKWTQTKLLYSFFKEMNESIPRNMRIKTMRIREKSAPPFNHAQSMICSMWQCNPLELILKNMLMLNM